MMETGGKHNQLPEGVGTRAHGTQSDTAENAPTPKQEDTSLQHWWEVVAQELRTIMQETSDSVNNSDSRANASKQQNTAATGDASMSKQKNNAFTMGSNAKKPRGRPRKAPIENSVVNLGASCSQQGNTKPPEHSDSDSEDDV